MKDLKEWSYATGAKTGAQSELVYIWDMYIDQKDKGTWRSAEEYNGEYDGSVYEKEATARQAGLNHLRELEDELELRGTPGDYNIDVIAIPKNKVSDYTLEFSGIK